MTTHQLLRESILLTFVSGNPRIDRKALITAVGAAVPLTEVDSMGNLGNINEWYVILKSVATRALLLACEELKVGDQVFTIGEPYKQVKTVRLLNIPPGVSDQEILAVAGKWGGKVLSVDTERLPPPHEVIKTFVRRVRIQFQTQRDEENVPISIRLSGLHVTVQLEGRQKVCYRCKQAGHVKAECKAEKCQRCYEVGHDDPECQRKRSYAAAAASTPIDTSGEKNQTPSFSARQEERMGREDSVVAPAWVRQQRVRICRACKQPGHLWKDCPQKIIHHTASTVPKDSCTTVTPGEVSGNEGLESPCLQSVDVASVPLPSSEVNISRQEAVPPKTLDDASMTAMEVVSTSVKNAKVSAMTNIRELYEAYKDPNNDTKRRYHEERDRSIDSDVGAESKKPHLHDSSASMMEDTEDGEVRADQPAPPPDSNRTQEKENKKETKKEVEGEEQGKRRNNKHNIHLHAHCDNMQHPRDYNRKKAEDVPQMVRRQPA